MKFRMLAFIVVRRVNRFVLILGSVGVDIGAN